MDGLGEVISLSSQQNDIVSCMMSSPPGMINLVRMPVDGEREKIVASFCSRVLSQGEDHCVLIFTDNSLDGLKVKDLLYNELKKHGVTLRVNGRRTGSKFHWSAIRLRSSLTTVRDECGIEQKTALVSASRSSDGIRGWGIGVNTIIHLDTHEEGVTSQRRLQDWIPIVLTGTSVWRFTHDLTRVHEFSRVFNDQIKIHRYFSICDTCCARADQGTTMMCIHGKNA